MNKNYNKNSIEKRVITKIKTYLLSHFYIISCVWRRDVD